MTTMKDFAVMHSLFTEKTAMLLNLHCFIISLKKKMTRICCFAGIVSSNTRDLATKVTYPHLNFSIPVTVFQGLLQRFEQTRDVNIFRVLDTSEKEVRRVWRLQGAQSKL